MEIFQDKEIMNNFKSSNMFRTMVVVFSACFTNILYAQPYLYNRSSSPPVVVVKCYAGNLLVVDERVSGRVTYSQGYISYKNKDGKRVTTNLTCIVEEDE